ncbi:bile acid:sodium symporter family protein [Paenibacillus rhizophilus]|nr:bile acid:sodium symporter family protein [Paenibacillus rhizophilus]
MNDENRNEPMLTTVNRMFDRIMPWITPSSLIAGMLLTVWLKPYGYLSIWLFAFMTLAGSLGTSSRDFVRVFRRPAPMLCALILLHFVMPLIAWLLGMALFGGDVETITGLVLGTAIPTGVTTLFWVAHKGGDVTLTIAVILLDTLLAPFVVPGMLSLLFASEVHIDALGMLWKLLLMIVFPSLLGMFINHVTKGQAERIWKPRLAPFSKIALGGVVALNGAFVAPFFIHFEWKLIGILATVILLTLIAYFFGYSTGRWGWRKDTGVTISLTYTVGMRNISAGAVIATTFLPAAAALPVVLAMLVQQLMASIVSSVLSKLTDFKLIATDSYPLEKVE